MKKYILLSIIVLSLAITSCTVRPYADFSASATIVDVGEPIYFTNYSDNFDYVEWDFGDGSYSNVLEPAYTYAENGTYLVTLSAYKDHDLVDRAYLTIEVLFPTTLHITVKEYYDKYTVPYAEVTLFTSYQDWFDIKNDLITAETDKYGVIVFDHLSYTGSYYVDVWEEHHHNYFLADEDIDFIRTLPLEPNAINYFTAWVDHVVPVESTTEKSTKKTRPKARIIKIEPRKFEDTK